MGESIPIKLSCTHCSIFHDLIIHSWPMHSQQPTSRFLRLPFFRSLDCLFSLSPQTLSKPGSLLRCSLEVRMF